MEPVWSNLKISRVHTKKGRQAVRILQWHHQHYHHASYRNVIRSRTESLARIDFGDTTAGDMYRAPRVRQFQMKESLDSSGEGEAPIGRGNMKAREEGEKKGEGEQKGRRYGVQEGGTRD